MVKRYRVVMIGTDHRVKGEEWVLADFTDVDSAETFVRWSIEAETSRYSLYEIRTVYFNSKSGHEIGGIS